MEQSPQSIQIFMPANIPTLVNFQVLMAKQTQNLTLQSQLVLKSIQYLSLHPQLGFYLVKLNDNIPIGSLLLTFQNQQSWWIQSVFVREDSRRKGYFKQLFFHALNLAKQVSAHSLKLYVEVTNLRAQATYTNLGMYVTSEKFYAYDFVYGNAVISKTIDNANNEIQFKEVSNEKNTCKNKELQILKQKKVIGSLSYFTQFSDWRFGLIFYIDRLCILSKQNQTIQRINLIHTYLYSYFLSTSELNVGAIRYITNEQNKINYTNLLQEGHIEHYNIMQIRF